MVSVVVVQVMQNAKSYHDVRISESRVLPKRPRVADYESPRRTMCPFGRSNIRGIRVEPEILDLGKPRQYLCRATSNIDHLITSLGPNMVLDDFPTQCVSPNCVLKQIVQRGNL